MQKKDISGLTPEIWDSPLGGSLREWRRRRRISQRDLACDAGISVKRLGFLEAGRSRPTKQTLLRLAACLDMPLRSRNVLLREAGFDAVFQERSFGDAAMGTINSSVEVVLGALAPNPAFAIDRHWTMLAANRAVTYLFAGAEPMLLRPPVNVLRLLLHPGGLASRVVNLKQWRSHMITRLRRQIDVSGDGSLMDLLEEVHDYPTPHGGGSLEQDDDGGMLAVPFKLATIDGTLSFFNTTTLFGASVDITVSELAIEAFMPADAVTAEIIQRVAKQEETARASKLDTVLMNS